MHKINSVTVLGTIALAAMIASGGFAEGGNTVASVIAMIVFMVSALLAVHEDGRKG